MPAVQFQTDFVGSGVEDRALIRDTRSAVRNPLSPVPLSDHMYGKLTSDAQTAKGHRTPQEHVASKQATDTPCH